MRFLYLLLAALSAVVCLASTYLFLVFAMAFDGGRGNMQAIVVYVLSALAVAALLILVAALINPRRATTRYLLATSAAIWLGVCAVVGTVSYADPGSTASLLATLKLLGLIALPGLLPLALLGLVMWKFPRSRLAA